MLQALIIDPSLMIESDLAVDKLAGGQIPRTCVNREGFVVEAERWCWLLSESQIGFIKGPDGSNVFPVPIVQKGLDVHAHVLRVRDDFTAKVVLFFAVFHQQIFHSLGGEDVDTHGGDVRHFFRFFRVQT